MYLLSLISVPQPFVIHFTCQLFIFGTRSLILFAPRIPLGSSRVVYAGTCLISNWSWIDARTLRVVSVPARLEPSYVGIYICIFISILPPICILYYACFSFPVFTCTSTLLVLYFTIYSYIAFCIVLLNLFLFHTSWYKISYDTRAKNVFLTSVITSLAFGSCCELTLVRKGFIALVA